MTEIEKPPEKAPSPWTPQMVQTLLAGLTPLADRYMNFQERKFQHEVEMERTVSRAGWWVLSVLMVFLAVVITLMSFLVLNGRVSGMPCYSWWVPSPATSSPLSSGTCSRR